MLTGQAQGGQGGGPSPQSPHSTPSSWEEGPNERQALPGGEEASWDGAKA